MIIFSLHSLRLDADQLTARIVAHLEGGQGGTLVSPWFRVLEGRADLQFEFLDREGDNNRLQLAVESQAGVELASLQLHWQRGQEAPAGPLRLQSALPGSRLTLCTQRLPLPLAEDPPGCPHSNYRHRFLQLEYSTRCKEQATTLLQADLAACRLRLGDSERQVARQQE
jgi:hypothetical protein